MNNKSRYPTQILGAAVETLAINRESIKERLFNAYINQLVHLNDTHFNNYNDEYLQVFNEVMSEIRKYKNKITTEEYPTGIAKPMINLLTEDEASDITRKIIDLEPNVTREFFKQV